MEASETEARNSSAATLLRLMSGFWVARALYVAAHLGIADLLAHGPQSTESLARETGVHAASLYRVMRALAGEGVFSADEAGRFSLTAVGERLRADGPGTLRSFILMELGDEHYPPWGALLQAVTTGETAFDHVYGKDLWRHRAENAADAEMFDRGMAEFSALVGDAIISSYDFSGIGRIVDVGGGNGSFLLSLLRAYPKMTGIVFDLPHVIEPALERIVRESGGRCEAVIGDFFSEIPAGADAYFLKWIIHDWDDERSIAILKKCRKAMHPGARLLVAEGIVPSVNTGSFLNLMDLNMLVMTGGRERTEAEYSALFKAAGLDLTRIVDTASEMSVMEGRLRRE